MKRKKAALCFALSLVMTLSISFPLFAMRSTDYETDYDPDFRVPLNAIVADRIAQRMEQRQSAVGFGDDYTEARTIHPVERQIELLYELMDLLYNDALVMPFHRGEQIEIPNIVSIITPSEVFDFFMIGLHIDHNYGFEDMEAMERLSKQPPPPGVAEFILNFAGIPDDKALVGYSVSFDIPRLPEGYVVTGPCPVWGDERGVYDGNDTLPEERAVPRVVRMGQMDHITGQVGGHITASAPPRTVRAQLTHTALHR